MQQARSRANSRVGREVLLPLDEVDQVRSCAMTTRIGVYPLAHRNERDALRPRLRRTRLSCLMTIMASGCSCAGAMQPAQLAPAASASADEPAARRWSATPRGANQRPKTAPLRIEPSRTISAPVPTRRATS
jgi:hypothetical protein